MPLPPAQAPAGRGERFTAVMTAAAGRLPFGLARIISPTLLGFAVISAGTFTTDLLLLTALHGGLHWPVPASITLSYLAASGLSYLLNRVLNFRSRSPAGRQAVVYAAVIAVNYLAVILGVGAGLAALGVNYQVARVTAGAGEAAYLYAAMRWVVFRDAKVSPAGPRPGHSGDLPAGQRPGAGVRGCPCSGRARTG